MAYSLLVLENEKQPGVKLELPLGFSWPVLLAPHSIALLSYLINTLLLAAVGIESVAKLPQLSGMASVFYVICALLLIAALVFSLFIVPLLRKDNKWSKIMLLAGILSAGLSVYVFAFIYNRQYLKDRLSEGFRITCILNLDGEDTALEQLNPVQYNETINRYYVWVSWLGIKFMRYFADSDQALAFVKSHPGDCLSIGHIAKTVAQVELDPALKQQYNLPFTAWAAASEQAVAATAN